MCLVALAVRVSSRYPVVLAANRDELHQRPTDAAGWWQEYPDILGGRDLVAGGSWLAVNRLGRIAAVTNVREKPAHPAPRSRGWLVREFLSGAAGAEDFALGLERRAQQSGAYNLLLIDGETVRYASNRAPGTRLPAGIHALSNAPLGTHWPKLEVARRGMHAALEHDDPMEALFALLSIRDTEDGEDRYARALFIEGADYGTRCSTVVLVSADGQLTFAERRFDEGAAMTGESRFSFESARGGASRG
jgi:uncharacterized protein with NRDE domain